MTINVVSIYVNSCTVRKGHAGLLGGAVYVNAFTLISHQVDPALREFSLAAASLGDSLGIACADIAGILIQVARSPCHRKYSCSMKCVLCTVYHASGHTSYQAAALNDRLFRFCHTIVMCAGFCYRHVLECYGLPWPDTVRVPMRISMSWHCRVAYTRQTISQEPALHAEGLNISSK